MIPPEIYFQKSCGMLINKLLTFSISVKAMIEIPRDRITTNTRLLLKVVSVIDLPTITGKSGKMHGARTVSTPAVKEINKKDRSSVIFTSLLYHRHMAKNASNFKEKVLKIVGAIPRGKTMTYQEVARRAGSPRAFRAVGSLMAHNFNPKIPCHRVIKSDGTFGNYNRGGTKRKIAILKKEGAII